MGKIVIQFSGSFEQPKNEGSFSAMKGGHAQAIAEAIAWLSSVALPAAIKQDHKLHDGGAEPELGFGGQEPWPPLYMRRDY